MNEHIKASHTLVNDQKGNPAFVVVPWADYQAAFDDVVIPHEVVDLMVKYDCTLLGAWRRYKGLGQKELVEKTGIQQSSISRMENEVGRYQTDTLHKLAKALNIKPEQLVD